jgi:hypothetical protein
MTVTATSKGGRPKTLRVDANGEPIAEQRTRLRLVSVPA